MRALAITAAALVALFATGLALADSEARQGTDWVRITARPCTNEKVLENIAGRGENPLDYRAASAEFARVPYAACWRSNDARRVIEMRYDDGDQGIVPQGDLKPVPEA